MAEELERHWGRVESRLKLAAFAAAVVTFIWMATAASYRAYFDWDPSIAKSVQSISIPGFKSLMTWISGLGSGWAAVALVGTISIGLLAARLQPEALVCAAGVGAGAALNRIIKAIVDRPRPSGDIVEVAIGYRHESFPSGHTVLFVTLFGFLFLLTYWFARGRWVRPGLMAVVAAPILLVGVSRVHLGAHWPSDVTGGYLLGAILLALMAVGYRTIKKPPGVRG